MLHFDKPQSKVSQWWTFYSDRTRKKALLRRLKNIGMASEKLCRNTLSKAVSVEWNLRILMGTLVMEHFVHNEQTIEKELLFPQLSRWMKGCSQDRNFYKPDFFRRGFTIAVFHKSGTWALERDKLTMRVMTDKRTSKQALTSQVGIGGSAHEAL